MLNIRENATVIDRRYRNRLSKRALRLLFRPLRNRSEISAHLAIRYETPNQRVRSGRIKPKTNNSLKEELRKFPE